MATDLTSTDTKDAFIDGYSGNAGNNYGSNASIHVYNYSGWQIVRSLISFTLPSLSGTITDVKLKLYNTQNQSNTARGVNVHLCTTSWTESTVTWNTLGGGGYNATVIDYCAVTNVANAWNEWVLQGSGADNPLTLNWGDTVNLLLKANIEDSSHDVLVAWNSKEATDSTKRPYLEITYTENDQSKMLLVF